MENCPISECDYQSLVSMCDALFDIFDNNSTDTSSKTFAVAMLCALLETKVWGTAREPEEARNLIKSILHDIGRNESELNL